MKTEKRSEAESRKISGAKNPCEKYELATTNYVMGEEMPISKEELFEHLRNCAKCRADLVDWQDMYASWRTEGTLSQAEVKEKWEAFLAELKQQPLPQVPAIKPLPGGKVLDNTEIGNTASTVWSHLAKNGWVNIKDLSRALKRERKLHPDATKLALGWLAYEQKIYLARKRQTTYVYLTEAERKIFQERPESGK